MRPVRLEFVGLKSYSERAVIDFSALTGNGLFGIFGDTGSGKSTILDAIFYALYGRFPEERISNDEFINEKAGGIFVDFTFSVSEGGENVLYRVKRELKMKSPSAKTPPSAKGELRKISQGVETAVADNVSSVNEEIEKLLGLSFDQFKKCIVLPQGQFAAFLTLTKAERIKIVSALFDLEKFGRSLGGKIMEKIKTFESAAERKRGQLDGFVTYTSDAVKEAEALFFAARTEYENNVVTFDKISEEFNKYKQNYDRHNLLFENKKRLSAILSKKEWIDNRSAMVSDYHAMLAVTELNKKLSAKRIEEEKARKEAEAAKDRSADSFYELGKILPDVKKLPETETRLAAAKSLYENLKILSTEYEYIEQKRREKKLLTDTYLKADAIVKSYEQKLDESYEESKRISETIAQFDFNRRVSGIIENLTIATQNEIIDDECGFLKWLLSAVTDSAVKDAVSERIQILADMIRNIDVDYSEAIVELYAALNYNDSLTKQMSAIKDDISADEKALSESKAKRQKIIDDGLAIKEQIDIFDGKFKKALEDYTRSSGESVSDGFTAAFSQAEKSSLKLEKYVKELKEKREKLFADSVSYEKEYGFAQKTLSALQDEIRSLEEEILDKLGDKNLAYAELVVNSVGNYETLRKEIDAYNAEKLSLENSIEQLSKDIPSSDYSEEYFKKFKEKLLAAEENKRILYKKYINLEKDSENISQKYKERCIIEKAYREILDEKSVYDRLFEVVRYGRLADFVADEYLSEICADAERTLSVLSSGRYGLRYRGDFFVVDYLSGAIERKTSTVSGGELFLVSLSLALALSSSIIAKSNKPIEFFFLDEGFGSLDGNLVEIVIDSLEKLKSSNFTIGLISHVEALKERIGAKVLVDAPSMIKGSTLTVTA